MDRSLRKLKTKKASKQCGKPYQNAFGQLANIWQFITKKERRIQEDFPVDVEEKVKALEGEVEALTASTNLLREDRGLGDVDLKQFLKENLDLFSKEERGFFFRVERMKGEVVAIKNKTQELIRLKEEHGEDFNKVIAELGKKDKGSVGAKKTKAKKIRERQNRFKRVGIKEKWIPL